MSWIIEYLAGSVGDWLVSPMNEGLQKKGTPPIEKLTLVLANGTPETGYQRGGVIEDTINVGGPCIDRSAEQVDFGRFVVNGLTITQDGEGGTSNHGRARGEGDSRVDNRDRTRLGVMERRWWEGRGERR